MQKVSVIMPAYNAAAFIAESIESVIAQTYPLWELIIVDDGSTDGTAAIAKSFSATRNNIIYIYQQNGGQGKARNQAFQKSSGELFAFLDADDVWLPDKLAIQVQLMHKHGADLVFSNSYCFNEAGNLLPKRFKVLTGKWDAPDMLKRLTEKNRILILTVLAKKEKILSVNGFTEAREIQDAEDYHLWVKLCFVGTVFVGIDRPLAKYRVHAGQVSRDRWKMKRKTIMALHELSSERVCHDACRQMILNYHLERPFTDYTLINHYFYNRKFFEVQAYFYKLRKKVKLLSAECKHALSLAGTYFEKLFFSGTVG